MNDEKVFKIQAELCRAMGSPLRMEIMYLLWEKPTSVKDLASALHQAQGTISRNLSILRNAGVLVAHRKGINILYHVADPKIMRVCDLMREVLVEQISERSKLMKVDKEWQS
jgi:DNA-binding transcriptional ArsR family regulator